jgi:hypothetical protein
VRRSREIEGPPSAGDPSLGVVSVVRGEPYGNVPWLAARSLRVLEMIDQRRVPAPVLCDAEERERGIGALAREGRA